MKSIATLLLAGMVQFGLSSQALAETELAKVQSAGTLKIGTEGTYPPFSYHDTSGKLIGFDVEIGREVAKRLNVKAEFVEAKWDGLIAGLDARRYDAVINQVAITAPRQQKYDFSVPYLSSRAVLIVRNDNSEMKSFDDLKGKKSAHTLTSNFAQLAGHYGAQIVGTDGFNQSVDLVASGRADATINDNLSYLDFKKHRPDVKVKIAATLPAAEDEGILLRKGNPELKAAIDKAISDIKTDGTYKRISQHYFGADLSE
ncbi:amino acid ABC transporter substrate-binding protein [Erwinia amylovora]|uniref:Amino acid ABC transporter substrate-binding protein n=3 Tax=Erwinia amylovora TaxID=552 RepID=A0ABX7MKK0_ERWAM|nr:amino acid ABC transporter substrate-binding protein [Erwinia amylovora]CDK14326.1 putative ABC transport system, periplasmic component [Erwinia amylovora LA635]CDK17693.1 putative ABC transport system, periplasmic component [Erwinia amylovora LA636]CDK21062.1 putative ABC transport system, periplasmic component [Erwinia amylovora LA637]ATZ12462.1 amino acid ABC transporter substrate-binding protein [Erwinia amylovora]EKV55023.1 putative ABC transport system, periplasmic component [Erwinia 